MKRPPRPSFTSRTSMQIPDPLSHHQPALVPRSSRAWPGVSPGAHIQIGAPLHSTGQGRPKNGTPLLAGARAAKEVAESNTFQIRDSAISNPRIWIVSELPAQYKRAGKSSHPAERIQRAIRHHLCLSPLLLSQFLCSPVLACALPSNTRISRTSQRLFICAGPVNPIQSGSRRYKHFSLVTCSFLILSYTRNFLLLLR